MFSVALLLALAAFAPILPTSSVDQAAIAVCFATEEDCAALAVRAINNAEREIFSASAELMVGPDCSARCVVRDTRGAWWGPISLDRHGAGTVGPGCPRAG